MEGWLEDFQTTLENASGRLRSISEAEAGRPPTPGKWSAKEVLGHLIDSAVNNHGRFVRAQLEDGLRLAGYAQDAWVSAQRYGDEPWDLLIGLWSAYNWHLLHVMAHVPPGALGHRLTVGEGEPITLEFLMHDYVVHLKHHLGQVFGASGRAVLETPR